MSINFINSPFQKVAERSRNYACPSLGCRCHYSNSINFTFYIVVNSNKFVKRLVYLLLTALSMQGVNTYITFLVCVQCAGRYA